MAYPRYIDGSRVVYWDDSNGNLTVPATLTASNIQGVSFILGPVVQFSNIICSSIRSGIITNGTNLSQLAFTDTYAPVSDGTINGINITALNQRLRPSYGEQLIFTNSSWIPRTPAAIKYWRRIAWSPVLKLYCAVADSVLATNNIMTSPDGINWTLRSTSVSMVFTSIIWVDRLGRFIAIGADNGVFPAPTTYSAVSTDGITWTVYTITTNAWWNDLAWSPQLSRLVAVSPQENIRSIAYSDNGGETWTTLFPATPLISNRWNGICWSGEFGLFVATGSFADSGSARHIMTSPDGITWTQRTAPAAKDWYSIAWSPELSLFAAVSRSGDAAGIMTSPNGVNWTLRTTPTHAFTYIVWSPELSMFVVTNDNSSPSVTVSRDGITWRSYSVLPSTGKYYGMTWSREQSKLILVDNNVGGSIITSEPLLPASQNTLLFASPGYASVNNSNGLISMSSMNISSASIGFITGGISTTTSNLYTTNLSSAVIGTSTINTNTISSAIARFSTINVNSVVVDQINVVSTSIGVIGAISTNTISTATIGTSTINTNTISSAVAGISTINAVNLSSAIVATSTINTNTISSAIASISTINAVNLSSAIVATSTINTNTISSAVAGISTINAVNLSSAIVATSTINTNTISSAVARISTVNTVNLSSAIIQTSTIITNTISLSLAGVTTINANNISTSTASITELTNVSSLKFFDSSNAIYYRKYVWNAYNDTTTRSWISVASSSDGMKLIAAAENGYIYTSIDGGITWSERTSAGIRAWYGVASSADGTKLIATVYAGSVYISSDSGQSWNQTTLAPGVAYTMVTSSANGATLVAATDGSYLYVSTDSGVNWAQRASPQRWFGLASSSDGTKLVACVLGGQIYTSADSGLFWFPTYTAPFRDWRGVASSADGTKLVAVAFDEYIYTSSNSGISWTARATDVPRNWISVTSSADGVNLVAVSIGQQIYTSSDSGVTWIPRESNRGWRSVTSSADGTRIVAVVIGGYIYTTVAQNMLLLNSDISASNISCTQISTGTMSVGAASVKSLIDVSSLQFFDSSNIINYRKYVWNPYNETTTRAWIAVASSSDGMKLIAAVENGNIYTSIDGGITWSARISAGFRAWCAVASSSDGTKLMAAVRGTYVYLSSNSGETWTQTDATFRLYSAVASSATGNTLVATVENGNIYVSTNGGSWSARESNRNWSGVAVSSDGTKLVAVVNGGQIYTSTDSGTTWSATSAPSKAWRSIASSADGTKLVALTYGEYIYTSLDSGINWTARAKDATRNWISVTSSADGVNLVAVVEGGQIYTSTDSGVTWIPRESNRNWRGVTSSADGTRIIAVVNSGYIYTTVAQNTFLLNSDIYLSNLSSSTATITSLKNVSSLQFFDSSNSIYYTNYSWTPYDAIRDWFDIAASSDGSTLIACVYNGYLYRSTNYGGLWTQLTNAGSRSWGAVASSSDGTKLVAIENGFLGVTGRIYTSSDSGSNWTARAPSLRWMDIASSSDGTKLVAVVNPGFIYTSTDSGVTWTQRESSRNWNGVASSSDGTKLVAVASGQIYTSIDSGVTWTARESNKHWSSVASSADGTKLVVVGNNMLYTSIDSGVSWIGRATDAARSWVSVASSADGVNLFAVVYGGQIYTSTDSGITWTPSESNQNWRGVTCSANGRQIYAVVTGGYVYATSPQSRMMVNTDAVEVTNLESKFTLKVNRKDYTGGSVQIAHDTYNSNAQRQLYIQYLIDQNNGGFGSGTENQYNFRTYVYPNLANGGGIIGVYNVSLKSNAIFGNPGSMYFYNNTSFAANVCIGTGMANPQKLLTLKGSGGTTNQIGFNHSIFNFPYVSVGFDEPNDSFFIGTTANATTDINTYPFMLYRPTGNIGIGITNPTNIVSKLNVAGSVFVGDPAWRTTANAADNGIRLEFDNSYNPSAGSGTPANKIRLVNQTTYVAGLGHENGAQTYHVGASGSHSFYTNASSGSYGAKRMEITSGGQLVLQKGNYNFAGNNTDGDSLGINFGSANVPLQASILCVDRTSAGGAFGGSLTFRTVLDPNVGAVERMRIQSDGKVGIGRSDPRVALDVTGAILQSTPPMWSYYRSNLNSLLVGVNTPNQIRWQYVRYEYTERALIPDDNAYNNSHWFCPFNGLYEITFNGDFDSGYIGIYVDDVFLGTGATNPQGYYTTTSKQGPLIIQTTLTANQTVSFQLYSDPDNQTLLRGASFIVKLLYRT
jgi:hypothetical protein